MTPITIEVDLPRSCDGSKCEPFKVEILPCPFCGNRELWIGPKAAMRLGVKCRWFKEEKGKHLEFIGCGAGISLDMDDPVVGKVDGSFSQLEKKTVLKAVELWNKRSKANQEPCSTAR